MKSIAIILNQTLRRKGPFHENHACPLRDKISGIERESPIFGKIWAVGSGGNRLIQLLLNNEENAKQVWRQNLDLFIPEISEKFPILTEEQVQMNAKVHSANAVTHGALSNLCASFLVNELSGFEREDYGGFIEYAFFDPRYNKWRMQYSYCYLFFEIEDTGKTANLSCCDFCLLYDNDENYSYIRHWHRRGVDQFFQDSIIEPFIESHVRFPFDEEWMPNSAVCCFISKRPGGDYKLVATRVLNDNEKTDLIFDPHGGGGWGVSKLLLEQLADEMRATALSRNRS